MMQKITYGAAILGLMVIGGMTATMVSLNVPFVIGEGDFAVPLQNILNDIMPCLLPMGAFAVMYYLLGKNIRISRILIGIVAVSIIGAYLNILG